MRTLAAWFLRALPVDERGRRAIDETLADWAHEDERPGAWGLGGLRSCRAVFSILRVVIGLAAWETVHVPFGWLAGRLALLTLVPAPLFYLASSRAASLGLTVTRAQHGDAMVLTAFLGTALLLLPLAFFYSVAWPSPGRPVPVLGVAIWSLIGALAIGGWVLPIVNQSYRELVFAALGGQGALARGLPELTLPQMASAAFADSGFGAARAFFVTRAGLYALCPAFVLLAAALGRLSLRQRRVWFAAVSIAFFLSSYFLTILIAAGGGLAAPKLRYVGGLSLWCLAVVSVVAALRLNARRPAPAPAPQSRQSAPSAP